MRVVIINDFPFVNGGASDVAINSAIALQKKGIDVTLFSGYTPLKDSDLDKVITTGQQDILNNSNRVASVIDGIWNKKAYIIFKNLIDNYSVKNTIIHVHTFNKVLSSSPIHYAIEKNYKIVFTVHDFFLACPNGGFFNYTKSKNCLLKPLSFKCFLSNCDSRNYFHKIWRINRQVVQKYNGGIPNRIKNFIFVSDFSKNIIGDYLPRVRNDFLLKNPIYIKKVPRVIIEENDYFAFIGRISPEKGVHLLCEAFKELKIKGLFIGDGPDKNRLEKNFANNIYTGWLSKSGMLKKMNKIKCIIFPSLLYETQGLVVAEAAAMGIPSIVSNNTAAVNYVDDMKTGLLFKSGDVQDLIKKIKLMLKDDFADQLGKEAYKRYWDNPSTIDLHIDKLTDIYQKILYN